MKTSKPQPRVLDAPSAERKGADADFADDGDESVAAATSKSTRGKKPDVDALGRVGPPISYEAALNRHRGHARKLDAILEAGEKEHDTQLMIEGLVMWAPADSASSSAARQSRVELAHVARLPMNSACSGRTLVSGCGPARPQCTR